ncbi:BON domain-containing protein [Dyadobacter sp. NIV53]|uniref:BON domain-containing protein n=1 Tax=Dyadobacter sp. NIV53 TaxID=2861765 RepID=UPI001C874F6E|nr:BON domain-containing protein [Dyadobacter sp. NIV53]
MSSNNRNRKDSRFDQNREDNGDRYGRYGRNSDRNSRYNDIGNQGNYQNDWSDQRSQFKRNDDWDDDNDRFRQGNRYNGGNTGISDFNYNQGNRGSQFDSGSRSNRSNYQSNYENQDRGFWDRTKDEVSSWFGDDDAERRRDMDRRQQQGEHRGRGPKGYRRSDDRIKDDINDRLSDDSWIDASEIEVKVENGEVTLTGTVDDRTAKRRAEDIADGISGVSNVENRIRVKREEYSSNRVTGNSSTQTNEANGASQSERSRTISSN